MINLAHEALNAQFYAFSGELAGMLFGLLLGEDVIESIEKGDAGFQIEQG